MKSEMKNLVILYVPEDLAPKPDSVEIVQEFGSESVRYTVGDDVRIKRGTSMLIRASQAGFYQWFKDTGVWTSSNPMIGDWKFQEPGSVRKPPETPLEWGAYYASMFEGDRFELVPGDDPESGEIGLYLADKGTGHSYGFFSDADAKAEDLGNYILWLLKNGPVMIDKLKNLPAEEPKTAPVKKSFKKPHQL